MNVTGAQFFFIYFQLVVVNSLRRLSIKTDHNYVKNAICIFLLGKIIRPIFCNQDRNHRKQNNHLFYEGVYNQDGLEIAACYVEYSVLHFDFY